MRTTYTALFVVILSFASTASFGQRCVDGDPDTAAFRAILRKEFSALINPGSSLNTGNYAALETKDLAATFGGSSVFGNGSVLGVKFSGAVDDDIAAIWNNRKLSSTFTADAQYHFIRWRGVQSLDYLPDSCDAARAREAKIMTEYDGKLAEAEMRMDLKRMIWEIERLKIAQAATKAAKTAKDKDGNPKYRGYQIDSLAYADTLQTTRLNALEMECDMLSRTGDATVTHIVLNQRAKALEGVFDNVRALGFGLSWFSIGYNYAASKFSLFNSTASLEDQVTKKTYGAHLMRAQYSIYSRPFSPEKRAYFISMGVTGGLSDNHEDLDEVTLKDETAVGADSLGRKKVATYNVLVGDYLSDLKTASVFAEVYYFVLKDKNAAFHFFPSYVVKDHATPSLDVGVGFFMGYGKKDSPLSALNVELFVLLQDVANGASSEETVWSRSDLGIRVAFPINFPRLSH